MYHCHHSKGPGGEIPVADGISLGSLWNRSGHSGHPGANISRSLSVERTDRAEYSIFKVQKVLFTIHAKYEIFFVGWHSFFKSSLQACGSATGFGESPPKFAFGYPNAMLAKPSASRLGAFGPLFPPSRWEKPAGRVNHAMIHSLPTFPAYSEKVNHSMIHFFRKEVLPYES